MMDSTAREVLIVILERLRYLEKDRREAMASLRALTYVVCAANPALVQQYKNQKQIHEETLSLPPHNQDDTYDGLITLLKSPGPSEKDEQERLRRLLESFEGPKQ